MSENRIDFASRFRELQTEFKAVQADSPDIGMHCVNEIAILAGRNALAAFKDGCLVLPIQGFDDWMERQVKALWHEDGSINNEIKDFVFQSTWQFLGPLVGLVAPGRLPPRFGGLRTVKKTKGITVSQSDPNLWHARARSYAQLAGLLAELCEARKKPPKGNRKSRAPHRTTAEWDLLLIEYESELADDPGMNESRFARSKEIEVQSTLTKAFKRARERRDKAAAAIKAREGQKRR